MKQVKCQNCGNIEIVNDNVEQYSNCHKCGGRVVWNDISRYWGDPVASQAATVISYIGIVCAIFALIVLFAQLVDGWISLEFFVLIIGVFVSEVIMTFMLINIVNDLHRISFEAQRIETLIEYTFYNNVYTHSREAEKEIIDNKFCIYCGKENETGSRFCGGCGKELSKN